jgi:hypothetical protein
VQALLPLADAGWHAAAAYPDAIHAGIKPANTLGASAKPGFPAGKSAPQPGLADDGCQLCLAIQLSNATLAADPPCPAAPVTFSHIVAATPPINVALAPRVEPRQARAPPDRA